MASRTNSLGRFFELIGIESIYFGSSSDFLEVVFLNSDSFWSKMEDYKGEMKVVYSKKYKDDRLLWVPYNQKRGDDQKDLARNILFRFVKDSPPEADYKKISLFISTFMLGQAPNSVISIRMSSENEWNFTHMLRESKMDSKDNPTKSKDSDLVFSS